MKRHLLLRSYVVFVVAAMLFGCHEDPAEPVVPTSTPAAQATPLPSATPTISADEPPNTPVPTPQPTGTSVSTPTPQATRTPVSMPTPHPTWTPFAMPTPQATWTPISTPVPQATWTPVSTPIPQPTWTPIPTWTPRPTVTPTPTAIPSATPTPVPAGWRVVYTLPSCLGVCKVNCGSWTGCSDCSNGMTRTIQNIAITNARQVSIEGDAKADASVCAGENGSIIATFNGSSKTATILCSSSQSFSLLFDFGGTPQSGLLNLSMGVSAWCTTVFHLTVAQK